MRRTVAIVLLTLALPLGGLAAVACADEVLLRGGGRIEGDVTGTLDGYRVLLASGVTVEVPAREVERVIEGRTARDVYLDRRNALDPTDADGLAALGRFCVESGLVPEGRELYRRAIDAAPDHEAAHAGLGEVRLEGRWVPLGVAMESQGQVRHGARWVTPEEKAALVFRERRARAAEEGRLLSARARLPSAETREGALLTLGAIDDPAWLEPLLDLSEHREPSIRKAALASVARLAARALPAGITPGADPDARHRDEASPRATAMLVRAILRDPEAAVQDVAADLIRARALAGAAEAVLDAYVDADHASERRRAARALGRMRWKAAFESLYSTLTYTVRVRKLVPVSYWTATIGRAPVPQESRFPYGRRRILRSYDLQPYDYRVVNDVAFNDPARQALKALVGLDCDYDRAAWAREWTALRDGVDAWMRPVEKARPAG